MLLEKANVKRSGAISMGLDGLNNAVIDGHATPEQYTKEITVANDGIVNQKTVFSSPAQPSVNRWKTCNCACRWWSSAVAAGELGPPGIALCDADRIIAIGSDRMMAAVARARHVVLAAHMKASDHAMGSINSPMQCMMKEICAQCLQTHVDQATGKKSVVFSCFSQDQPLDCVD